jgi:hypothetical protein
LKYARLNHVSILVYNHFMSSRSDASRSNLRVILILVFTLLVLAGYFIVHKPVTPEVVAALGLAGWRILVGFFVLALAGAAGNRTGFLIADNPASTAVIQAGLGLGILSIYILIAGSLAGVNWITLGAIPLVTAILLRRSLVNWCRMLVGSVQTLFQPAGKFEKWLAAFMFVIFAGSLISALAPPFHYDALMYHLVMPLTYVQQGRITHIPWLVMTGMPQCTEMLYTMAVQLGGLPAAAVTGWMAGLIAILGIAGFFKPGSEKGSRIGFVAAASLLAGETFTSSLSWAYIDWMGLLFGVCCLICLHSWLNSGRISQACLAGVFTGLAFTTKYTGGILFLCGFTAVVFGCFRSKKETGKFPWKTIIAICAGAVVFPAAWLARNLILTGNPVYPFLMPAAEMDAVRLSVYQGAIPYGEWWEGLLLPVRVTLWGLESAEGYSVSIGPLLLILGLCNLLRQRELRPEERNALHLGIVFFVSVWLFWAVGNRLSGYLIQTRMYFSIFPAFTVLAALGWDAVREIHWQNVRMSRVFGAVILLSLGFSMVNLVLQTVKQDALRVDAGLISSDDYLDLNLGWYAPAMRAVDALPAGSKTFFLYEPRGLACVPACDPDEILDHWKISRMEAGDAVSILELWKQKGYNYLLVNQAGMHFLADGSDPHHPASEVQALQDLLQQAKLVQSFGESYQIYKLP